MISRVLLPTFRSSPYFEYSSDLSIAWAGQPPVFYDLRILIRHLSPRHITTASWWPATPTDVAQRSVSAAWQAKFTA